MKNIFLLVLITIFISSCATRTYVPDVPDNPFKNYYEQYTVEFYPPTEEVDVQEISYDDAANIVANARTQGYEFIGESIFNGRFYGNRWAEEHARDVGAEHVRIWRKYIETETNTNYNYYTESYNFNNVRRYDQGALYFSKYVKPLRFGVYYDLLTNEEKILNEINYGLKVAVVVNNLPFFNAGVVPGDILLEIDGRKLVTFEDFYDEDDSTTLRILRNQKIIVITLRTPAE